MKTSAPPASPPASVSPGPDRAPDDTPADEIRPIVWRRPRLLLLDQRRLPAEETWLELDSAPRVADAIGGLVVRGAPAIGITAAYGAVISALTHGCSGDGRAQVLADLEGLRAARPTAVNLMWAVDRMKTLIEGGAGVDELEREAVTIHQTDIAANHRMGALGAALIENGSGVLTHCNTGALATGGFGTALGVVRQAWREQRLDAVYAGETRPWLQGSRLTMWELLHEGIDARLICDSAAAALLASGRVQWVITGADRVTANGDVINKIGTYGLAVLARHHGVRFMVVAPVSTLDRDTAEGSQVAIENRAPQEVTHLAGQPLAAAGSRAWNPVFDCTPAALVDALVTEAGVVQRPNRARIEAVLADGI